MENRLSQYLLLGLALLCLVFMGCEEDDENGIATPPPSEPINTGSANFARYVALGNSLAAGYQSNALSERDQVYSYPNQIAKHVGTTFEQPLIMNPGIGARQRLISLTGPVIVNETGVDPTSPASNLNGALPRPYNNLGIPGAIIFDMADSTDFGLKSVQRQNPFFAQILRTAALGKSIIAQAVALNPTFISVWIGNNDVLGYATSGGRRGTNAGLGGIPPQTRPTETVLFDTWFRDLMSRLKATGAGIVAANIPNVTSIPFFTTMGPQIKAKLPAGVYMRYQRNGNNSVAFDSTRFDTPTAPLITLIGSTYAPLLGQNTGKWYRDNRITTLPPGIDTTKPFGFHPQNPWPDALTLDSGEQTIVADAVAGFNASIDSICANRGIGVVNFNSFLRTISQTGLYVSGLGTFSSSYITGGVFSYDGVHPTSRGGAIIANEWIKVINSKFNASIPPISPGSAPGIPIGKLPALGEDIWPNFGSLDDLVNMMSGGGR